MAQFRLDGFAIIVGAAGGIGREVALTFAEAGVKGILLADINPEAVAQVADQSKAVASNPNYRSISTTVDVADVTSVDALVNLAKEQFDRIDYCVNAFGVDVAAYVPFDETDPDDYDRVLGINTKGVFLITRAVAKVMKSQEPVSVDLGRHGSRDIGRGAIVNVSSAMALVAVPAKAPYTTSKHAVTGVTKAAVMDYKSAGIRINQQSHCVSGPEAYQYPSGGPFLVVEFALIFYMLSLGLGRHIDTLPPENIATSLLVIYIVYFFYDIGLFLTKASALLFFSRVFTRQTHITWFNYALWTAHALNLAWLLGIVFGTVFMCDPVAKNYIPDLPGRCGDTGALWIGSAVPSVLIDLIILLLPLPKIWGLQLSLAKKSGISIVFLLGYCVIIVSVGRLITVIRSADALTRDLTYEGVPALYWLCAESPITLVSICLPPMMSLGRYLVHNYFSPLMSNVSSFVSSRKSGSRLKSEVGDFTGTQSGRGFRLRDLKSKEKSTTSVERGSVRSMESSRRILHLTPMQDYEAHVEGGREPHSYNRGSNLPDQSIQIDKTVEVRAQET
ncbi:hypothetical protein DL767_011509 [Monosporascus sp. MG133]|nr:hypothetical protein DL767_011509 [Monosporascus sp. MG133]